MAINIKKIFSQTPKNIVFALILFSISVYLLKNETKKNSLKVLGEQTQVNNQQELLYQWEQIVTNNPNYRDGWLQLSSSYYKIGNFDKAKEALLKAKELDPNNKSIQKLEELFQ